MTNSRIYKIKIVSTIILLVFAVSLTTAVLAGNQIQSYFQPQQTIYDKLRDAQISLTMLHQHQWDIRELQTVPEIVQVKNFQDFKSLFEYRSSVKNSYDGLWVNIDAQYRVVWMELWKDNNPNITFVGIYFYTEPGPL